MNKQSYENFAVAAYVGAVAVIVAAYLIGLAA